VTIASSPAIAPAPLACPHCAEPLAAGATRCGGCGALRLPDPLLAPGQTLADGRYGVLRLLAPHGTLALAAEREAFDRAVVVKALLDYYDPDDPQAAQIAQVRFLRQVRALAELRHPAVPQLYGYFHAGAYGAIVTEYVDGESLAHRLTHADPASGAIVPGRVYDRVDVIRWGIALCAALEYLADRRPEPALHLDIKPSNLVFDRGSGDLRLVDFGVSRARLLPGPGGVFLIPKHPLGTPGYAAPEQHNRQHDPRGDVYGLAATLYHLATDDDPCLHPFDFPRLGELGALGQALRPALALDPAQRATAGQLRRQLERAMGGASMQAIEAPDGQQIPGMGELAAWGEAHWQGASAWFAGALPDQIERLWGKIRLAQQLRDLGAQYASDKHALADAALALFGPADFGAAAPELRGEWPVIDFGPLAPGDREDYYLKVWNSGRRYICADIVLPAWVRCQRPALKLAPGESASVLFQADTSTVPAFNNLRDYISFQQGTQILLTVEVRAQSSRLSMFWELYGVAVVIAIPILVALLVVLRFIFART